MCESHLSQVYDGGLPLHPLHRSLRSAGLAIALELGQSFLISVRCSARDQIYFGDAYLQGFDFGFLL